MLNPASRLSSSWEYFVKECERLNKVFVHLQYPFGLVDSVISHVVSKQYEQVNGATTNQQQNVVSIILPFENQKSANLAIALRPVLTSRKIRDDVKMQEEKPSELHIYIWSKNFSCLSNM